MGWPRTRKSSLWGGARTRGPRGSWGAAAGGGVAAPWGGRQEDRSQPEEVPGVNPETQRPSLETQLQGSRDYFKAAS